MEYKSEWFKRVGESGLPKVSASRLAKADEIALAAETEWESWGHWLIEPANLELLLGFSSVSAARSYGDILTERSSY